MHTCPRLVWLPTWHRILINYLVLPSVFIFKYDPTTNLDARLEVYRAYPILQGFSISMAQAKRAHEPAELPSGTNPTLIQSPSGGPYLRS